MFVGTGGLGMLILNAYPNIPSFTSVLPDSSKHNVVVMKSR